MFGGGFRAPDAMSAARSSGVITPHSTFCWSACAISAAAADPLSTSVDSQYCLLACLSYARCLDRFFLRPAMDANPLSPFDCEMARSCKVVIPLPD